MEPGPKKLLDQVRDATRLPCRRRTVQTLLHPHRRSLRQLDKTLYLFSQYTPSCQDVRTGSSGPRSVTHLAVEGNVAAPIR